MSWLSKNLDYDSFFDQVKSWNDDARGVITGATGSKRQFKYQTKLNAQQYAQNLALQDDAQAFNSSEAQKTRDYETEMSNSAYQRQKADLIAAGYNPLLAINGGGASTPTSSPASSGIGSTSSGSAVDGKSSLGDIFAMFNTIGSMVKLGSEIEANKANTAAALSHADLMNQQSEESSARTILASAQAQKQSMENASYDAEAAKRKQKYGEGPFGFVHAIGGLADDAAKAASKLVDHLSSRPAPPSSNSARGANERVKVYENELSKILDKVLDESADDSKERKASAQRASSWLPSHF